MMFFLGGVYPDNSLHMEEIKYTPEDMIELIKYLPDDESTKEQKNRIENAIYSYANGDISLRQLRQYIYPNAFSDEYKTMFFIKFEDLPLLMSAENDNVKNIILSWRFFIGK